MLVGKSTVLLIILEVFGLEIISTQQADIGIRSTSKLCVGRDNAEILLPICENGDRRTVNNTMSTPDSHRERHRKFDKAVERRQDLISNIPKDESSPEHETERLQSLTGKRVQSKKIVSIGKHTGARFARPSSFTGTDLFKRRLSKHVIDETIERPLWNTDRNKRRYEYSEEYSPGERSDESDNDDGDYDNDEDDNTDDDEDSDDDENHRYDSERDSHIDDEASRRHQSELFRKGNYPVGTSRMVSNREDQSNPENSFRRVPDYNAYGDDKYEALRNWKSSNQFVPWQQNVMYQHPQASSEWPVSPEYNFVQDSSKIRSHLDQPFLLSPFGFDMFQSRDEAVLSPTYRTPRLPPGYYMSANMREDALKRLAAVLDEESKGSGPSYDKGYIDNQGIHLSKRMSKKEINAIQDSMMDVRQLLDKETLIDFLGKDTIKEIVGYESKQKIPSPIKPLPHPRTASVSVADDVESQPFLPLTFAADPNDFPSNENLDPGFAFDEASKYTLGEPMRRTLNSSSSNSSESPVSRSQHIVIIKGGAFIPPSKETVLTAAPINQVLREIGLTKQSPSTPENITSGPNSDERRAPLLQKLALASDVLASYQNVSREDFLNKTNTSASTHRQVYNLSAVSGNLSASTSSLTNASRRRISLKLLQAVRWVLLSEMAEKNAALQNESWTNAASVEKSVVFPVVPPQNRSSNASNTLNTTILKEQREKRRKYIAAYLEALRKIRERVDSRLKHGSQQVPPALNQFIRIPALQNLSQATLIPGENTRHSETHMLLTQDLIADADDHQAATHNQTVGIGNVVSTGPSESVAGVPSSPSVSPVTQNKSLASFPSSLPGPSEFGGDAKNNTLSDESWALLTKQLGKKQETPSLNNNNSYSDSRSVYANETMSASNLVSVGSTITSPNKTSISVSAHESTNESSSHQVTKNVLGSLDVDGFPQSASNVTVNGTYTINKTNLSGIEGKLLIEGDESTKLLDIHDPQHENPATLRLSPTEFSALVLANHFVNGNQTLTTDKSAALQQISQRTTHDDLKIPLGAVDTPLMRLADDRAINSLTLSSPLTTAERKPVPQSPGPNYLAKSSSFEEYDRKNTSLLQSSQDKIRVSVALKNLNETDYQNFQEEPFSDASFYDQNGTDDKAEQASSEAVDPRLEGLNPAHLTRPHNSVMNSVSSLGDSSPLMETDGTFAAGQLPSSTPLSVQPGDLLEDVETEQVGTQAYPVYPHLNSEDENLASDAMEQTQLSRPDGTQTDDAGTLIPIGPLSQMMEDDSDETTADAIPPPLLFGDNLNQGNVLRSPLHKERASLLNPYREALTYKATLSDSMAREMAGNPVGRQSMPNWLAGISKHAFSDLHRASVDYMRLRTATEKLPERIRAMKAKRKSAKDIPLIKMCQFDPVSQKMCRNLEKLPQYSPWLYQRTLRQNNFNSNIALGNTSDLAQEQALSRIPWPIFSTKGNTSNSEKGDSSKKSDLGQKSLRFHNSSHVSGKILSMIRDAGSTSVENLRVNSKGEDKKVRGRVMSPIYVVILKAMRREPKLSWKEPLRNTATRNKVVRTSALPQWKNVMNFLHGDFNNSNDSGVFRHSTVSTSDEGSRLKGREHNSDRLQVKSGLVSDANNHDKVGITSADTSFMVLATLEKKSLENKEATKKLNGSLARRRLWYKNLAPIGRAKKLQVRPIKHDVPNIFHQQLTRFSADLRLSKPLSSNQDSSQSESDQKNLHDEATTRKTLVRHLGRTADSLLRPTITDGSHLWSLDNEHDNLEPEILERKSFSWQSSLTAASLPKIHIGDKSYTRYHTNGNMDFKRKEVQQSTHASSSDSDPESDDDTKSGSLFRLIVE